MSRNVKLYQVVMKRGPWKSGSSSGASGRAVCLAWEAHAAIIPFDLFLHLDYVSYKIASSSWSTLFKQQSLDPYPLAFTSENGPYSPMLDCNSCSVLSWLSAQEVVTSTLAASRLVRNWSRHDPWFATHETIFCISIRHPPIQNTQNLVEQIREGTSNA